MMTTAPRGWKFQRSEISIETFDEEPLSAPLAMSKGHKKPQRPSAVVSIARTEADEKSTVNDAARAILAELARVAPGLTKKSEKEVCFADGVPGLSISVSFEPAPGVRAAQLHLFRLDGRTLMHAGATVEERRFAKLKEIEAMLLENAAQIGC